ncbi:MAG: hypothetical protein ACE361_18810 [Aureliella sp.]
MTNSYKLFVGADEAGYGPNLGPLVVAGTAWRVPESISERVFCEILSSTFGPRPLAANLLHVPLGDSKRLYKPKSSLKHLEAGIWALLPLHTDANFGAFTDGYVEVRGDLLSWYGGAFEKQCPSALSPEQALALRKLATGFLNEHDIQLLGVQAIVIAEGFFNSEVERTGSKGQLLSSTTLKLVSKLQSRYRVDAKNGSQLSCEIFCDRQGGRRNYLPVMQEAMPDSWFQPAQSSRQADAIGKSAERISYEELDSRTRIHFTIGGDSFPPAGLASMVAKYVREQLMWGYNDFWSQRIPGIKPTAGYPQDAKRFEAEVASEARRMGVDSSDWWRCR